jgi:hypothetical protein
MVDLMTLRIEPPTGWPDELAMIGAIRFARRSCHFESTVRFYRDLIGLPLCATFAESYGSTGASLHFPNGEAQHEATARLSAAGVEPVECQPYWAATGAITYRDPDGREVVFTPFVFAVNEPPESNASGQHS